MLIYKWSTLSDVFRHFVHTCSMQPLNVLRSPLQELADSDHYLFSATDLQALFPHQSYDAFRRLLSRAVVAGILDRVCRGIYIACHVPYERGYELFHAAARLRAVTLTYLSYETAGILSGWFNAMLRYLQA